MGTYRQCRRKHFSRLFRPLRTARQRITETLCAAQPSFRFTLITPDRFQPRFVVVGIGFHLYPVIFSQTHHAVQPSFIFCGTVKIAVGKKQSADMQIIFSEQLMGYAAAAARRTTDMQKQLFQFEPLLKHKRPFPCRKRTP